MEARDPHLWKQAKSRAGFKMHLRTYLLVNGLLWLLWLASFLTFHTDSAGQNFVRYPWPIWPTLGWGIGLLSHYFAVYHGFNEKSLAEREYERLRQKQL